MAIMADAAKIIFLVNGQLTYANERGRSNNFESTSQDSRSKLQQ